MKPHAFEDQDRIRHRGERPLWLILIAAMLLILSLAGWHEVVKIWRHLSG